MNQAVLPIGASDMLRQSAAQAVPSAGEACASVAHGLPTTARILI